MSARLPRLLLLVLLTLSMESCRVVGGIFKAGFLSAVILIVVIVVVVGLFVRGRRGP